MTSAQDCNAECPVARAARVLDGKWTTLVVRELLGGAKGFAQLQRGVGTVSPRLLTARLRLLEDEGVLTRTVHPTQPPTTEYALTEHGRQLQSLIEALAAFGVLSQQRDAQKRPPPPPPQGVTVHRLR